MKQAKPALIRLLALLLSLGAAPIATPVLAQSCTPMMEETRFCPEGTDWASIRPTAEPGPDGKLKNLVLYHPEAVLIFSRVPQRTIDFLPEQRGHREAAAAVESVVSFYPDSEVLARFSPLGEDKAVASLAFHDARSGWTNLITYYMTDGHNLTIQTAQKGAKTLSERHRDLHMQAVATVQEIQ